jgi:hypothetical protein
MSPILRPRLLLPRSGFAPPVNANLLMWFDASTISGADGSTIAQWNDSSGHSNHATQSTAGDRPTLKKNKLNGRAAVQLNIGGGTTQNLVLPNAMGAPSSAEYFIVAQADADPSANVNAVGLLTLCGNIGDHAWPFTNGAIYDSFGGGADNHQNISKSLNLATTGRIYNARVSANHFVARLNGTIIRDDSYHTMDFTSANRFIGRPKSLSVGFYWRGFVYEILVYNTNLTAAQRAVVNSYLAAKYAITGLENVSTAYTPDSFSGLAAWYKADSLVLNNTDPVSTWADQSGNARHITQAGAARPLYQSAGLNSKPSVRFTTAQSLNLASTYTVLANTPLTVLAVGKYTADCSVINWTANNNQIRVRRGGVNEMSMFINSGSEALSGSFVHTITDAYLGTWRRVGTNSIGNILQNGDIASGASQTNSAAWAMTSIGGGVNGINLAGDISEFCLYDNNALSNADVWNLYESYFRDKWALP